MRSISLFLLAIGGLLPGFSNATFVIQCFSRLLDERADPIMSPGALSAHVHVIAGGNGFGLTETYAQARAATCTTCNVKEDLSNYWTPKLYYRARNGSFISVPINGDNGQGQMGGMAIYYLHRPGPKNDKISAFPKGFRMVAGDAAKRTPGADFASQAVRHRCIGTDLETTSLPNQKCPQGIRAQVVFPACWDGKNIDSPDHKSHVSYPATGNFDGGECPSSHPVHLMTLFYEVTYRTDLFNDMWHGNAQPFVFSNGDPTGYGFHGDFFNGWNTSTLERAVKNCVDGTPNCPGETFTFASQAETQACKIVPHFNEEVDGVLTKLPGCNPVSTKPGASKACPASPPPVPLSTWLPYTDLTKALKWKYVGCAEDTVYDRIFPSGAQEANDEMTVETCVNFCEAEGFTYAGLEYQSECYCGSALPSARAPAPGVLGNCNMKCKGNMNETCGGAGAISIYQACGTGMCTNAKVKREIKTGRHVVL